MALVKTLSQYWLRIQSSLFPWLEEELGEMTEKEQKLVATLELVRVEKFTASSRSLRGRPPKERGGCCPGVRSQSCIQYADNEGSVGSPGV